jgi:hypothetical protein
MDLLVGRVGDRRDSLLSPVSPEALGWTSGLTRRGLRVSRRFATAFGPPAADKGLPARYPKPSGISTERGDSNPRRTERPLPVFETATGIGLQCAIYRGFPTGPTPVGKSAGKSVRFGVGSRLRIDAWVSWDRTCRRAAAPALRSLCRIDVAGSPGRSGGTRPRAPP